MKKPKGMASKTWKQHLKIMEMNKEIAKKKMKNPLYVPWSLDYIFLNDSEYKTNKKKK